MPNNNAIGVFDSGLGGLTAVKQLLNILPNENIIYFGDTGRVPYGTRSKETIKKYAIQDTAFLLSKNVKMIIVACGTVSSVVPEFKDSLDIPFIGVVTPTSISAASKTKNGKIGIIGTTATIKSRSYYNELKTINKDLEIFEQDCPLFVPLVENGFTDKNDPIVQLAIKHYLSNMLNANIDTLILGCTHYPIISKAISNFMGNNLNLINSGYETAIYAKQILSSMDLLNNSKHKGNSSFYISDSVKGFSDFAKLFLGRDISDNVKKIDIELY